MNQHISQFQREQAAHQWHQCTPTQGMPPDQIEAFAQRILGGEVNSQVSDFIARSQQQRPPMPGHGFQPPFGLPTFPHLPMPRMPNLFPGMHPPPSMQPVGATGCFPPAQPRPFMPMPPPPMSPMPQAMPPFPQAPMMEGQSRNFTFSGGFGNTQNASFTGQSGDTAFTYSSSTTNWSSEGLPGAANLPESGGQGVQLPRSGPRQAQQTPHGFIEEVPSPVDEEMRSDPIVEELPSPRIEPIPLPDNSKPQHPSFIARMGSFFSSPSTNKFKPRDSSPRPPATPPPPKPKTPAGTRRVPSIKQAVPPITPLEGTSRGIPQNPRLHRAFSNQLNPGLPELTEEMYFGEVLGAPDAGAGKEGMDDSVDLSDADGTGEDRKM